MRANEHVVVTVDLVTGHGPRTDTFNHANNVYEQLNGKPSSAYRGRCLRCAIEPVVLLEWRTGEGVRLLIHNSPVPITGRL
jgi:hypothetical protein